MNDLMQIKEVNYVKVTLTFEREKNKRERFLSIKVLLYSFG